MKFLLGQSQIKCEMLTFAQLETRIRSWLGPLVALAGLGWLTFLWPSFAKHLGLVPMITGLLGEGSLTICLLVTRTGMQPV